ncbi:MAG: hypothetical protein IJ592_05455 [Candidatus Methanomethylophilaceae archaeon]|nr:hypothetical protein [Candidatus Methanomethylophilaceae archaeon]
MTLHGRGPFSREPRCRAKDVRSHSGLVGHEIRETDDGTFISRPNRFIAMMEIDGVVHRCHVKNTGRYHKLPYIVEAVRLFLPEEQLYLFRIFWIYPINLE